MVETLKQLWQLVKNDLMKVAAKVIVITILLLIGITAYVILK